MGPLAKKWNKYQIDPSYPTTHRGCLPLPTKIQLIQIV